MQQRYFKNIKYLDMKWVRQCLFMIIIPLFCQQVAGKAEIPAPQMYSVSVDPETGNDIITWISSTDPRVDLYTIGIALITIPGEPYTNQPIGNTYVPGTSFINTDHESSLHSVGYSVWGVDDLGGGSYTPGLYESPPDSTIFLEYDFDTCEASITLRWNDYNKWRGSISQYIIYRRRGAGIYESLITLQEGTNTTVLENLSVDEQYELFVTAVHEDGRTSNSNMRVIFTEMSSQPGFLNADYATISPDNHISLSFTLDPSSELTNYILYRSPSMDNTDFREITGFTNPGASIDYTDNISFRSGIYYYRLDVLNDCNQPAMQSNLANNIIVIGTLSNFQISLSWNKYMDWLGGVERYNIIRTIGRENPRVDVLTAGFSNAYTDNIGVLADYDSPESSLFCYEIEAIENTNSLGIQGRSRSNKVCFSVRPEILLPNAFIPNDDNVVNQVFEPVFSFIPEHYDLVIYNRLGTMVWQGSGPWDGKMNGKYVPEGVYVYNLKIYNYSTDITEKSGSITVLYR